MDWRKEVLALIAQMKRESNTARYDNLAIDIITSDIRPLVMADNLNHWLELHGKTHEVII